MCMQMQHTLFFHWTAACLSGMIILWNHFFVFTPPNVIEFPQSLLTRLIEYLHYLSLCQMMVFVSQNEHILDVLFPAMTLTVVSPVTGCRRTRLAIRQASGHRRPPLQGRLHHAHHCKHSCAHYCRHSYAHYCKRLYDRNCKHSGSRSVSNCPSVVALKCSLNCRVSRNVLVPCRDDLGHKSPDDVITPSFRQNGKPQYLAKLAIFLVKNV